MSDIIPTIDQLIESFEKNGMEKFASQLKEVKASLGTGFRPKLERRAPQKDWKSVNPGDDKFDRGNAEEIGSFVPTYDLKLDKVIERFTKGVKGELGIDYFKPIKEAPESLRVSDFDRLIREEKGKKALLDIFFKPKNIAKKAAFYKLVELSDAAKEKGFDAVSKRLMTAAEKVGGALVDERHEVRTMEAVFENSDGPNNLVTNLEKAHRVYEGAASIVKLFVDTYKKNPPESHEGTVDLLRKTDKMIAMKFNELNKIK